MITAEIITDDGRLTAIAGEWAELWSKVPGAPPFASPAWLLPWRAHFAPGPLLTFTAWSDGRLAGLAPGYIETGALGRRILPLGISLSDHLDVLADPACESEALTALSHAALSTSEAWDSWDLEELAADAAALRLPLPDGCGETLTHASPCPVLDLRDRDALPRAKRRQLNLARNRAARRGAVQVRTAGPQDAAAALEHLLRLHRLRWEGRGEPGVLASDAVQAFQRAAVPELLAAGLLQLTTLAIGGTTAAALYELVNGDRTLIYLSGFDPAFAHESPNVILFAHAIDRARADGRRLVDFGRGQEAYKYGWGAADQTNVKRTIRHGRP